MSHNCDGPPDLEDVDVAVPVRSHRHGPPDLQDVDAAVPARPLPSNAVPALVGPEEETTLRLQMMESARAARPVSVPTVTSMTSAPTPSAVKSSPAGTTGLKKGFLLGGAAKQQKSTPAPIVTLRPQAKAHVITEVQEAMKDAVPPMQRLAADTQSKYLCALSWMAH